MATGLCDEPALEQGLLRARPCAANHHSLRQLSTDEQPVVSPKRSFDESAQSAIAGIGANTVIAASD